MKPLKKIAIIPNLTKHGAFETAVSATELLQQNGAQVCMAENVHSVFDNDKIVYCKDHQSLAEYCDVIITVGGDGTIIHASKHASLAKKPLLGINMGRLGFVAGLEPNELFELKRLITGDYTTERRQMLRVTYRSNDTAESFFALNDAVISRGSLSKMTDLDIYLGKSYICHYRADGLIVSTPTGSSAYALSAGGPVIEPTMNCTLLTPICSHSLFSRPILFNSDSRIIVSPRTDGGNEVYLTIDGENPIRLLQHDLVEIVSADIYTELVVLKDTTFYKVLNDKFTERGL